jgi:hypothetical protein
MGDVTPFGGSRRGGPKDPDGDRWLRRQALQLVAQMPDDPDDALRIIQLMDTLVRSFLNGGG